MDNNNTDNITKVTTTPKKVVYKDLDLPINESMTYTTYTLHISSQDNENEIREFKVVIQQPDFETIQDAMTALYGAGGQQNLIKAGRIIFTRCLTKCKGDLKDNPKYFSSLAVFCMRLAQDFLATHTIEIKKN